MHSMSRTTLLAGSIITLLLIGGCMEEVAHDSPKQANTPATAPMDPASSLASQGGGSALGGAKRTATNIVEDAEAASRRAAGEDEPTAEDE